MKNCRDWAFSSSGFGSGAASLSAADHGVVVSKICYVWLCSQLCYQTAANQITVVEIELLAIVLSAAHVRKMWRTAERRIARHVCLRHPLRPFHFGIPSIQSLPEAGSWEPSTLHQFCSTVASWIMPIPSLHLQKNEPVSRREAKRLVKQLWSPIVSWTFHRAFFSALSIFRDTFSLNERKYFDGAEFMKTRGFWERTTGMGKD